MELMKISGSRIKALREQKELSQKDVADKMHKSASAYSRLENGQTSISLTDAGLLSEILGCAIEDLVEHTTVINTANQHNQTNPDAVSVGNIDDNKFISENNHNALITEKVETVNYSNEEKDAQIEKLINTVIDAQKESEKRMWEIMQLVKDMVASFQTLAHELKNKRSSRS